MNHPNDNTVKLEAPRRYVRYGTPDDFEHDGTPCCNEYEYSTCLEAGYCKGSSHETTPESADHLKRCKRYEIKVRHEPHK